MGMPWKMVCCHEGYLLQSATGAALLVLYWLLESAKLRMADKTESIALDDEWVEW